MNLMTPIEARNGFPAHLPLIDLFPGRQREVVRMVCLGLEDKEIARAADLSPHTVKMHTRDARRKVGANNRTHLALIVAGILPPVEKIEIDAWLASIVNEHRIELCLEYSRTVAVEIDESDTRFIGEAGSRVRDLWHQMETLKAVKAMKQAAAE